MMDREPVSVFRRRNIGQIRRYDIIELMDGASERGASDYANRIHAITGTSSGGNSARPRITSEIFSAIMMVGALVLPPISVGITEASITRNPSRPITLNCESTTAIGSLATPILQVPTG